MLDPSTVEQRLDLNIDLKLSDKDRNILVSSLKQEWFDILQRVMEEEIKRFNFSLLNTPTSDKQAVLDNHLRAQVVSQWYVGVMRELANLNNMEYYNAQKLGTMSNPEPSQVEPDFA